MIDVINSRLHPEGYHGRGRRPPYFEGWYFKIVDPTERHRYAVIPGISLGTADGGPHSFVQVLDGVTGRTLYERYPVEAFSADEQTLDVRVGPNRFTWDGMTLDLSKSNLPIRGEIRTINPKPWPVTLTSPGIMGWFAWIPRMECYHGVLSLDHALSGTLSIESNTVDFTGGRGYIEKDWGQAFPSGWVWMQTNHFGQPGTCLTASIAMIPWVRRTFPGFIVGLFLNGTLYRFATYTGATTTHLAVTDEAVTWVLQDGLYRLEIVGHRADTGALRGPSKVDMARPVPETLSATVDVVFSARNGRRVVFAGTGLYAGMEIGGDFAPLLTSQPAGVTEGSSV
jgi:hypothetical protein